MPNLVQSQLYSNTVFSAFPAEFCPPMKLIYALNGIALCLSLLACTGTAQTLSEAELGLRIMANRQQGNCVTCHQVSVLRDAKGIDGATGKQGDFGPSLDGVANRYSLAQLRDWVMDARRMSPNTLMPPFGTLEGTAQASPSRPILSLKEIDNVTAALATLR